MLKIEKDHKVGWLTIHVSGRHCVWLFMKETGNGKGYKKMEVLFCFVLFSGYKQKEVDSPG